MMLRNQEISSFGLMSSLKLRGMEENNGKGTQ